MRPIRCMLTGIASLLLAAGVAHAQFPGQIEGIQPPTPIPGFGGLGGGELISAKHLEKLALTEEQKKDFDKLNEEFKKKQKELQPSLVDLTNTPDPAKVKASFDAQLKLRPDYLAKVEKLLTEEQKKSFEEVRRASQGIGIGGGLGGGGGLVPPPFGFGGSGLAPGQFLPATLQEKLKLTADQKKKVDELQKELEAKILGLLTDEQKKELDNVKKQSTRGSGFTPPNPLDLKPPTIPKLTPPDPKGLDIPNPGKLEAPPPELKKS